MVPTLTACPTSAKQAWIPRSAACPSLSNVSTSRSSDGPTAAGCGVNAAVNACRPTAVHAYTVCRETAYSRLRWLTVPYCPCCASACETSCSRWVGVVA